MYPEGTTTNGDYLIEFKRGAFMSMSALTVVCIKYHDKINNVCIDAFGTGLSLLFCTSNLPIVADVWYYESVCPEDFGITDKSPENWK